MGVSFRTYIVAGVKADEAVKVRPVTRTVTKYDPDTGEPYEKEVPGTPEVFLFGLHMTDVTTGNPEDVLYAFGKKTPKDLEVFGTGGDADERLYVIGVQIARLDPCDEPFQLDDDTLARGRGKARVALEQVGYNHGVHAPIGIYVIHYAG